MRGRKDSQEHIFFTIRVEDRIPPDHPLRRIKRLTDEALKGLSPIFSRMYSRYGRPSVPPERLLKAQILLALYSVRSDRLLCEMLEYNLLFRWFLDMDPEERGLDATTFTKNRERLLEHGIAKRLLGQVVKQARTKGLLSDEHFSVDGSLIEAWASQKSFSPKDEDGGAGPAEGEGRNPSVDFHGERRTNETHCSQTDPEARLMRKGKGKEAKLVFHGHTLMDNRHGLIVEVQVTSATGTAEREAAVAMLDRQRRKRIKPKTLGADKGYDTRGFVAALRRRRITPHVAANTERRGGSAVDGRTTRHVGYGISQRVRKRVEEIFGWLKTVAGVRRSRFKGRIRTELQMMWASAAYNLLRMAKLGAQEAKA
jgi:transposase